jgi:serine phosphatase RsbU (regulator of sigma subunit)
MCQTWQNLSADQFARNIHLAPEQAEESAASENVRLDEVRALKDELAALRLEQAKLYRGIYEAAQVQRRLCAPRQFRSGEFEAAGEIFPVRYLSGDFFKVMDLGSALGVVVGDIAGKGLSAGIWLPYLISLIHRCAETWSDPAEAVAQANRELCAGYGEPPLVALLFARIDLADGEIVYCNAGLPSPLILGTGDVTYLDRGGPMLGAMSGAGYVTGRVNLEPGETLIACSDGVTECLNSRDEELQLTGLLQAARAISAAAGRGASQMLFSTLGAVLDFADGRSLADDLTLLVVRREAKASTRGWADDRNLSALVGK